MGAHRAVGCVVGRVVGCVAGFGFLAGSLTGCGGRIANTTPPRPAVSAAQPAARPPVRDEAPGFDGVIRRRELDVVLDAGLGNFLRGVETSAHVAGGRFVGFRIVSFYPHEPRLAGVDLKPGDTVTRVNGRVIERPEQADQVWRELRVASELVIEYQRQGQSRKIRYAILD